MWAVLVGCGGNRGTPPPLLADTQRSDVVTPERGAGQAMPVTSTVQIDDIQVGMSRADVERMLGHPDDVLTPDDHPGTWLEDTSLVWAYGTNGHNGFARRAAIYFGRDDRVIHIYGKNAVEVH